MAVEPFASNMDRQSQVNPQIRKIPTLIDLYNPNLDTRSYQEVMSYIEDVKFALTAEDCDAIRRIEPNTAEWFHYRAGRITASKFRVIVKTNKLKPALSVLKQVCYPLEVSFSTEETAWGIEHEDTALQKYITHSSHHTNLRVSKCGLIIDPTRPEFGVTPDALVECDCCGAGCIEVTCPFKLTSVDFNEFASQKTTCLILEDGSLHLDVSHAYYYQVQLQMKISNRQYCDFVVWSEKDFFVQRIFKDDLFCDYNMEICLQYHKKVILPEIICKYFSKPKGKRVVEGDE